MKERLAEISKSYNKTAFMRICRILPAFGIAGVLNNGLRSWGEDMLVPMELRSRRARSCLRERQRVEISLANQTSIRDSPNFILDLPNTSTEN